MGRVTAVPKRIDADNAGRCAIMVFFVNHMHCMQARGNAKPNSGLTSQCMFSLVTTQQIQYLVTLCSKLSSSFPHGTCLRPVSRSYLSLHETYRPLCTPFPKIVILNMHTVASPCPNAVHMEPFSTSIFKILIEISATATKICNRSCFTKVSTRSCTTNSHAILRTDAKCVHH